MRQVHLLSLLASIHAYTLGSPLGPHTRSGELFCWGYPDHRLGLGGLPISQRVGQLSLSPSTSMTFTFPTTSRLALKFTSLSMSISTESTGGTRTCGILVDGSVACFGDSGVPRVGSAAAPMVLLASGASGTGQVFTAVIAKSPSTILALSAAGQLYQASDLATPFATGVVSVDCTQRGTCCAVVMAQSSPACGVIECWSHTPEGACEQRLPCGTPGTRQRLTSPAGVCFTNVSLASNGTAGGALSSTGEVWTWGSAEGMGAGLSSDPPLGALAEVLSLPEHTPAGQTKVRYVQLSTAGGRLAGVTSDGRLLHFGRNPESFGTGQIREDKRHTHVSGVLSRGPYTCAVDTAGRAYCVGSMERSSSFTSPQAFDQALLHPAGKAWRAMYAGSNVFCGIDADSDVYCARLPYDTTPDCCGVPGIPADLLGLRHALSTPTLLAHNNTSVGNPGVVAVAARGDKTAAVLGDGQGVATGPVALGSVQASPLFTLSASALEQPSALSPRPGQVVDAGLFEYPCWVSTGGQLWCQANDRVDSASVAIESIPPSAVTSWWLDSGSWPLPANGPPGTLSSLAPSVWSHWQGGMAQIADTRTWRTYFEFCECGLSVSGEAVPGHSYFGPSHSNDLTAALGGLSVRQSLRFTTMCRGVEHGCFLAEANGTLVCWGTNSFGQLGGGPISSTAEVAVVVGIPPSILPPSAWTGWAKVSCGGYHTCAMDKEGELFCWGKGADGALGRGASDPFTDVTAPTRVQRPSLPGAGAWMAVAAADRHTCAILDMSIRPSPSVTPTATPSATASRVGSASPGTTPSASRSTTPTATPSPSPSPAPPSFHGKLRINNLPAVSAALPSARAALIQIVESLLQLPSTEGAVNVTAVEDAAGSIVWPVGGSRPPSARLLAGSSVWSMYYIRVLTGRSRDWASNATLPPSLAAAALSDYLTGARPLPPVLASAPVTHWQTLATAAQVPTATLSAAGPMVVFLVTGETSPTDTLLPTISGGNGGTTAAVVIMALIAGAVASISFVPECRPVRARIRAALLSQPLPPLVRRIIQKRESKDKGRPHMHRVKQTLFHMPDQRVGGADRQVGYAGTHTPVQPAPLRVHAPMPAPMPAPVCRGAPVSAPSATIQAATSTTDPSHTATNRNGYTRSSGPARDEPAAARDVVVLNPLAAPQLPPAAHVSLPTGAGQGALPAAAPALGPAPACVLPPPPPLPPAVLPVPPSTADTADSRCTPPTAPVLVRPSIRESSAHTPVHVEESQRDIATVLLLQRVVRGWRVRRRLAGWVRVVDADGDIYWFNTHRQASSWYAPGYDPQDLWHTSV